MGSHILLQGHESVAVSLCGLCMWWAQPDTAAEAGAARGNPVYWKFVCRASLAAQGLPPSLWVSKIAREQAEIFRGSFGTNPEVAMGVVPFLEQSGLPQCTNPPPKLTGGESLCGEPRGGLCEILL